MYGAPPFGDELLDAAKIVFGVHLSNNAQASLKGDEPKRDNPLYWSTQASLTRTNALFSRRMASCIMIFATSRKPRRRSSLAATRPLVPEPRLTPAHRYG